MARMVVDSRPRRKLDIAHERICPNCDDGCQPERYCDGCNLVLCTACYLEHNEDAPCHVGGGG